MKKLLIILLTSLLLISCGNNNTTNNKYPNNIKEVEYKAPELEEIVKNIEKEGEEAIEFDNKTLDNTEKNTPDLQANITENINKNQEELEKIKNTNNSPSIESMNNTETTANNTQENLEDNAEIIDKIDEKNNNEEEFFGYGPGAVNVKFSIKKLVDYNTCILTKTEFDNLEDNAGYEYNKLCAPKYKFIGEILAGNPDKIEFYSCSETTGYTLQKFKPGDKIFEYNIASNFDNVCENAKQRSYEMKYYKNNKQLDEINAFKDILPEEFIYKKGGGIYFGDYAIRGNCLLDNINETQICYDKETKTLK
ncbi:MAG: hypothetical protein N4A38_02745 [Candidatus Gracilibacteria bacterium]|nr:hypothetical protein [Candidatus Gracilibacteria bacterium]